MNKCKRIKRYEPNDKNKHIFNTIIYFDQFCLKYKISLVNGNANRFQTKPKDTHSFASERQSISIASKRKKNKNKTSF